MPEVSAEQMQDLGAKLDALGDQLTDQDREVLLTTFGLAAQTLGNVAPGPGRDGASAAAPALLADVPTADAPRAPASQRTTARDGISLSDGLTSVFFPGRVGRFEVPGLRADGVEVGGTVTWSK